MKEINMYPYIMGLLNGITATIAMIIVIYFLWPIKKLEGKLKKSEDKSEDKPKGVLVEQSDVALNQNLPAYKEVEKIWYQSRFSLFFLFLYGGLTLMSSLVEISGGYQRYDHGLNTFLLTIIAIIASFGWGVISWYLARFYLRGFAPILYNKYRPYYSSQLRKKVQEAMLLLSSTPNEQAAV